MLQWLVQLGSLHLSSVQLSGQQNENENEDENEDQEQDHDQSGIIEKRDRLTSRVTSSTWSSKKKMWHQMASEHKHRTKCRGWMKCKKKIDQRGQICLNHKRKRFDPHQWHINAKEKTFHER